MSVATEENKRIFISNAEVAGWNYRSGCISTLVLKDPVSLSVFDNNGLIPYAEAIEGLNTPGFYASNELCMDCRTRGSNIKPLFW